MEVLESALLWLGKVALCGVSTRGARKLSRGHRQQPGTIFFAAHVCRPLGEILFSWLLGFWEEPKWAGAVESVADS